MKSKLYAYFKNQMHGDYKIWLIVMILNAFGMVVQFSAKGRFNMEGPFEPILGMIKPLVILFISFWVMAWVSRQDYVSVIKYITLLLFLSWGLILFAYFFGTEKGGASRWVDLGPVSFMPSDMAKLCLTISLAKMFSTRQANPAAYTPWVIFLILAQIGITCFLVILSNVSTSGIIFTTSLVVMVFGRVPWKSIGIIFCIVAALAVTVIYKGIGQRSETAKNRIENYIKRVFLHSDSKQNLVDDKKENYQLKQSLYAISTGALRPKGPGKSQFKFHLTQAESDFVYAIIIEEYGIVAGLFIPFLFMALVYRGALAIKYSAKPIGGLMAAGLAFSISTQAFINMLVSVGALPVTGQPIPMVSAGGTSLFFTAISIGLMLSISKDKKKYA